jgi:maltooligosyltrehalose trehalohydrolase
MPVGAEFSREAGGTDFRVWAPNGKTAAVVFENSSKPLPMSCEDAYFTAFAKEIVPGQRYKYQLDEGEAFPDPASRWQPAGPHGFSAVVDAAAFRWSDGDWPGVKLAGQVIYELHLGTFTPGGSWTSAGKQLPILKETGITAIEVMPVAEFPGKFGWGYDGVQPYAPASIYGTPDDMRAFVDQAHAIGLGVILDVVYNHIGPDGNYLTKFSPYYLSKKHKTDWGEGLNFDGEHSEPVREFFRENAAYWIREFHLDGLRLDATQDIHDESETHILAEIGLAARGAAGSRDIIIIGENERQDTRLLKPVKDGGYGLDALWNDDFHHSAVVALTGHSDAYYSDYRGTPQELLSAVKYGYLFQGQWYEWQNARRGHSTLGLPRASMINFIENHDQIANSARGQRLHQVTAPGQYRAVTALMLLAPGTPMLFQGQEFGASSPFLYFADHKKDLAAKIREGRKEFLGQWRTLRSPGMQRVFADPGLEETFERSRLDHAEAQRARMPAAKQGGIPEDVRAEGLTPCPPCASSLEAGRHEAIYQLHCDLLRLRKEDAVISRQGEDGMDGAVLSQGCFLVRFFGGKIDTDRLLVVNLGVELHFRPSPEPLLGPPEGLAWQTLWSSEDPRYGGNGTAALDSEKNWRIPGYAAVLLQAGLPAK